MNIYQIVKNVKFFFQEGRRKWQPKCFMFALFDWNIYLMQFAKNIYRRIREVKIARKEISFAVVKRTTSWW